MIAVLVVSKARDGLQAPGFSIARGGGFEGDPSGSEVPVFYAAEFEAAVEFWRVTGDSME